MWRAVGCFLLGFPPRPTCVSPGVTRSPFSHSPSLCLYSNSQSLLGWTYTRSRPERALVSLVPEFDIHSVDGMKQENVTESCIQPSSQCLPAQIFSAIQKTSLIFQLECTPQCQLI